MNNPLHDSLKVPTIRELEPFSFWSDFSSAIEGWGGERPGPDPYYCFHTPYTAFEPGHVTIRITLFGAHATVGEFSVRIHAYRPDAGMDAVMVGHTRVAASELSGDPTIVLRIAALPGVVYAVYGRFAEPSDLRADGVRIVVEEAADDDPELYASESLEKSRIRFKELARLTRLIDDQPPRLAWPVSQPFTRDQLIEEAVWDTLPDEIREISDEQERWIAAYCLQALKAFTTGMSGATGILVGPFPARLEAALLMHGCIVAGTGPIAPPGQFDVAFVRWPDDARLEGSQLTEWVLAHVKHLLHQGIAIFLFPADVRTEPQTRNVAYREDIQRCVLKLIGHGVEVAQLCFPEGGTETEPVAFGLLIQR